MFTTWRLPCVIQGPRVITRCLTAWLREAEEEARERSEDGPAGSAGGAGATGQGVAVCAYLWELEEARKLEHS